MRPIFASLALFSTALVITLTSCKKTYVRSVPPPPTSTRSIKYILYTTHDFSTDHDSIIFRVQIFGPRLTIFDSALAPMLISEIPAKINAIVVDKAVPSAYDKDSLLVGFDYKIKDVGESWFRQPVGPAPGVKQIEFDFQ